MDTSIIKPAPTDRRRFTTYVYPSRVCTCGGMRYFHHDHSCVTCVRAAMRAEKQAIAIDKAKKWADKRAEVARRRAEEAATPAPSRPLSAPDPAPAAPGWQQGHNILPIDGNQRPRHKHTPFWGGNAPAWGRTAIRMNLGPARLQDWRIVMGPVLGEAGNRTCFEDAPVPAGR